MASPPPKVKEPQPAHHEEVKRDPPKPRVEVTHTKSRLEPVSPKAAPTPTPTQNATKPAIDLTPTIRDNGEADRKRKEKENQRVQETIRKQQEQEAREWREYNDKVAKQIGSTTEIFRNAPKGHQTQIDIPGNTGAAFVNYAEYVRDKYEKAWIVSDTLTDEESTARVSISIARNGRVVASRIERRSGNPVLDRSVQQALDRVNFIAPFPEGSADEQRTFFINFNLKSTRLSG